MPLSQQQVAEFLDANLEAFTRATRGRVLSTIYRHGGCLAARASEMLWDDARSAVGEVSADILHQERFEWGHPLQLRVYVIKCSAGKVLTALRDEWQSVPLDDEQIVVADTSVTTQADPPSCWLTSLPRGRPARPLYAAMRAFGQGSDLTQITHLLRDLGIDLSEGQLAVEICRAMRYAKKGNRHLSGILQQARPRLEEHLRRHLVSQGLRDDRVLTVVLDQAFGVPDAQTADSLGISRVRVRNMRRDARIEFVFVRDCFENMTALGWRLGRS